MITRRVARPLLSSIFITGGIEAIRHPGPRAQVAEPVIDLVAEAAAPVAQKVAVAAGDVTDAVVGGMDGALASSPFDEHEPLAQTISSTTHHVGDAVHQVSVGRPLPFENETYVRVNGAIQVGAGVLLAFGRVPRIASAALAATLVPTTFGGHRFWEHEGDERKAQQVQFVKNVSLLGGLILASADTQGAPGLAWRASHARKDAGVAATAAKANAVVAAHAATADAKAAKRLASANAKVAGKAGKLGAEVAVERAGTGWRAARRHAKALRRQSKDLSRQAKVARRQAKVLGRRAAAHGHDTADLAGRVGSAVAERASDLVPAVHAAVDHAMDRAEDLRPKVHAAADRAAERTAEVASDLTPKAQALGRRMADALPVS